MRAHGALLLLAAALAPAALSAAAALPPSPPAYGVQITKTWIPMRDGTVIRTRSWDEQIPRDHQ
jgi:hypothetical protein